MKNESMSADDFLAWLEEDEKRFNALPKWRQKLEDMWNTIKYFSFRSLYYKIYNYVFSPYTKVSCRQMERCYWDKDELLFHAMFQILVDFIEKEEPYILVTDHGIEERIAEEKSVVHDWLRQHLKEKQKLWKLYNWYVLREYDKIVNDDERYEEQTKRLHQLIRMRGLLWN